MRFNPLIQSTVEETLRLALMRAENQSFEVFRGRRAMCLDYFFDRILSEDNGSDAYLKDFFKIVDKDERDQTPAFLGLEHIPLTKKIVSKKAKIYKTQPTRKLKGNVTENYQTLLARSRFFSVSKKIDELTYLLNDICVGVFVDPVDNKRLMFRVYTDFVPLFDRGDPFRPVAVVVRTSWTDERGNEVWVYYDRDEYRYVTDDGTPTKLDGETGGEHNYGGLPFFFPHYSEPVEHFFGSPRVNLIQANQNVDIAKSALNQLMKYNGFKQLVIVGETGESATNFILGKSRALILEPGQIPDQSPPNASVLDMQAEFTGHIDSLKFSMEVAAWAANVNIRWRIEGGQASGVSLRIQDLDDLEDRQQAIEIYQQYVEDPLFEIVGRMKASGVLGAEVEKGSVDDFSADFEDVEYPETVEEVSAREKHELEVGITNPIKMMQDRNPDLGDEEAARQYIVNTRVNDLTRSKASTVEDILEALKPADEKMVKELLNDES